MTESSGFEAKPSISELADRCIQTWESKKDQLPNQQLFVGVAGGPGSGKTTTCLNVALEIQTRRNDIPAIVVPMDGFHYHTDNLERIAQSSKTTTFDELMLRRGAPWTFDAKACVDAFQKARHDGEASLPIYDRRISNPVPNGVRITRDTSIVLFEGNYLLAFGDPEWAPLKEIFDDTWFVECASPDEQKVRLIGRHLRNWNQKKIDLWGAGEPGARKKVESSDWPNVIWIAEKSRREAKLIVQT